MGPREAAALDVCGRLVALVADTHPEGIPAAFHRLAAEAAQVTHPAAQGEEQ